MSKQLDNKGRSTVPKASKESTDKAATLSGLESLSLGQSQIVNKCFCCNTILAFPNSATKYKCSICHTTNFVKLQHGDTLESHTLADLMSFWNINCMVEECFTYAASDEGKGRPLREIFQQVSTYLYNGFKSYEVLNNSFKVKQLDLRLRRHTANIDFTEIRDTFNLLIKLPTKDPFIPH